MFMHTIVCNQFILCALLGRSKLDSSTSFPKGKLFGFVLYNLVIPIVKTRAWAKSTITFFSGAIVSNCPAPCTTCKLYRVTYLTVTVIHSHE